jgi:sulfonate transport system permease protein
MAMSHTTTRVEEEGREPTVLRRVRQHAVTIGAGLLLPVFGIALWQVAAQLQWTDSQILVPPSVVAETIVEFCRSGELPLDIAVSVRRVMTGFVIGGALGLTFGIAAGLDRRVEAFAGLTFHVLRQIPVMAWLPLLVLLAGFGETFKILVIALAAFFPISLSTLDGVKNVSAKYFDVGKALCFSRRDTLFRIVWPAALPDILNGLRLSLSRSWMLVVAAEIVGSTNGIGHRMDWGRQLFQIDIVFMGVLTTGLIGLLFDVGLRRLVRSAVAWKAIP